MSAKIKILFVVLYFSILYYSGNIELLNQPPVGSHTWRQADCASFAKMYYEHGMNFLEPRVHNYLSNDGYAAGECPYLYYFIAILYKLFGQHDFIFRGTTLFIFFIGLYNLFLFTYRVTKDQFAALIVPLLLYSIPYINFFSVSFLPDTSALSFTFVGWNFLYKYRETAKNRDIWIAMFFFSLGILLKANAALSLIAIAALFSLEMVGWVTLKKENSWFKRMDAIPILFAFLLAALWYRYAIYYNQSHFVSFLGTSTWPGWPIWESEHENFFHSLRRLVQFTNIYWGPAQFFLFILLSVYVFINNKELSVFFRGVYFLLLIGIAAFVFNFYVGVSENIYYTINLTILPVFTSIFSFHIFKKTNSKIYESILFKGLVLAVFVYFVYDMPKQWQKHNQQPAKWNSALFYEPEFLKLADSVLTPKDAKIICIPDVTPNATLYNMNRQGWTSFTFKSFTKQIIASCALNGAKYIIVDSDNLQKDTTLKHSLGKKLATYKNAFIYTINPIKGNRIKTKSNVYLFSDPGKQNKIIADKTIPGLWETFYIHQLDSNHIALVDYGGNYWCSELNTTEKFITASKQRIADWETFETINHPDGSVSFRAANGKYLLLHPQTKEIRATSKTMNDSTLFFIE
ncbi:MAG: glycosyltransferase family 39 protein [Bacteroidetes bacterium]|nr:glycosyltransferase family 39 protein [Bacteroidota bacterium]